MLRRVLSRPILSVHRVFTTAPPTIPANLQLADIAIFEAPKAPLIPNIEYAFPIANPPTSITALNFHTPGESSREIPINPKIFGVAIRRDIVHEVIRYHRNKIRQPYKTKRPSELRGSGKKPHAQKGIGKSQAGNKRNSSWVGGFKAHGPVARDFSIDLNRKYRAMGMMIALAAKQREGNLFVFDDFDVKSHRTKDLRVLLAAHGLAECSLLMVDATLSENFHLASRNLPLVEAMNQMEANVYEIVKREKLAVSVRALELLQTRLMEQYTHQGKRKALLRGLAMMQAGAPVDIDPALVKY